jgi:tetratricopeptide (TPR) repeat protein
MLRLLLPRARQGTPAPGTGLPHLAQQIEELEIQAWSSPWDRKGRIYSQLGDLCVSAHHRDRALIYYGLGIDAHLKTGRFSAAAALCRQVIELAPEVVRARCTLAFLALCRGQIEEFDNRIAEYVRAAQQAGQCELAATRLRLMATATDSYEVRLLLGCYLKELGDPGAASEVFDAVFRERKGLSAPQTQDQQARWARLLRVAITGPVEREPATVA